MKSPRCPKCRKPMTLCGVRREFNMDHPGGARLEPHRQYVCGDCYTVRSIRMDTPEQ